jgi:hypothetical protein
MALETGDVGSEPRTSGVRTSGSGGPSTADRKRIHAAEGHVTPGQTTNAALNVLGNNTGAGTDNFRANPGSRVRTAQAAIPFSPMFGPRFMPNVLPRVGPMIDRVGPRPNVPFTLENRRSEKWDRRGLHIEKQDGGVTPGDPDNRNPDLDPKDDRSTREDGVKRGQRERRLEERREMRRDSDKSRWQRLREWLFPPRREDIQPYDPNLA